MGGELTNPMDLSAEAMLELEELGQGQRAEAPALGALLNCLRTPPDTPTFQGQGSVSLLADVRSYALLRDSVTTAPKNKAYTLSEFQTIVEKYLEDLEAGVAAGKPEKIAEAKRFCLSLTENFLARQMAEIYQRRESADSRYVSHDSIL